MKLCSSDNHSTTAPSIWFIKMFSKIGLLVIHLFDNWNWSRNIVITRVSGISAEGNPDSYENSFIFIQYILGNSTASVLDDLSKILVAFNFFFQILLSRSNKYEWNWSRFDSKFLFLIIFWLLESNTSIDISNKSFLEKFEPMFDTYQPLKRSTNVNFKDNI